jgi:hypothetical protein
MAGLFINLSKNNLFKHCKIKRHMAYHKPVWIIVLIGSIIQMLFSGLLTFVFLTTITYPKEIILSNPNYLAHAQSANEMYVILSIVFGVLFLLGLIQAIAAIALIKKEETYKKGCMIVFAMSILSLNIINLLSVVLGLFTPSRKQT